MKKISFQGELGAYSHLACQNVFSEYGVIPCRNFEDALNCVSNDEAEMAMIPVENTVAGRVADIHTLLGNSNLKIYAEHFEKVRHQLIVRPDANLSELKNVRSHVMGIGQCKKIIEELALTPIIMADTAGSAKFISEEGQNQDCAIASELAAKIYELKIIKENIEDDENNTTRFLIMSKQQQDRQENQEYLTSCIFEVKSIPSALYKALGGLATNGVNLIKLESFISDRDFNKANFYIEFEGNSEDKSVKEALDELRHYTNKLNILGVYPKHTFRFKN
jgi:prephenate dehydratase